MASTRTGVKELRLPILGVTLEVAGVSIITALAPSHPNIYEVTNNSWANFPWGILTAMITPDTDTFLYLLNRVPLWWFTAFFDLLLFMILAGVLIGTSLSTDPRETRTRSRLFFILLFIPSIISNMVRLAEDAAPNIGPSGVIYSIIGLLSGFWLASGLNAFRGGLKKNLDSKKLETLVALVEFGTGVIILALSFIEPVTFFSVIYYGLRVDFYTHVWAFYSTVGVLTLWGLWKRPGVPLGFAKARAPSPTSPNATS